ncbi:DUF1264-domain-containing protein [Exidia glandulosa HHB12029]|uniref:DUF1264-domain-containing protein n=1 Tax=Exidia glandulosa HHB12029 TaxID=1314781 RepID=A0A165E9V2_EXIGL|nr:DUF1264-domain-containing protein [Exidia glandulosa HHB12029]
MSCGDHSQPAYGTPEYHSAGAAVMSFAPIQQIHQHICAFHPYAHDKTRATRAHHFCTHIRPDMHQCVIYDGPGDKARLIGIEYIVTDELFKSLPEDEKKYWHSHKYEVESGLLMLVAKPGVSNETMDTAEQPAMRELRKTYGKTIHTWIFDEYPDLPLGPPQLMMSWTNDSDWETEEFKAAVAARDAELGVSTEGKRTLRAAYLPKDGFEPDAKADYPTHCGKSVMLKPVEVDVKPL